MPESTTVHLGGCLCGTVRYRIAGLLGHAEHCHCSMCRKAHGAAFSSNTVVSADQFQITEGADAIAEYESSPGRRKCFCRRCGSQLFIRRLNNPSVVVVALGSIDGQPEVQPLRHVFVASKAGWLTIADGLPQYEIYP